MAVPATKDEAETVLHCKISNLFYGNDGYLVKDPTSGESNWIPKSVFEKSARIIDSTTDRLSKLESDAEAMVAELKLINKSKRPSMGIRNKIYSMTRRIETLRQDCESLVEMAKVEFGNEQ